jgi:hypothetical protein
VIPVSLLPIYRKDGSIDDEKVHSLVIPVSMLVVYRQGGSIEASEG